MRRQGRWSLIPERRHFYDLRQRQGKLTCQLVHLARLEDGSLSAIPDIGRSGLISTLSGADGYILIEENKEGLKKGERVSVYEI